MAEPEVVPEEVVPPRPTNLRFKTHPEFARKLKHLQQSDPVNPKELARRLELCLVEQDAIERGETVQTKTKKIRFSSSASRTPSDPPTPQLSVLPPLSFNSDALARSLQFHKFTNNADSNNSTIASPQGAGRKVEPLPFQFPVLADEVESPLLRHSLEEKSEDPVLLKNSPRVTPPPPRTSRIEPLKADLCTTQDDPVSPIEQEREEPQQRPKSMPYVPRNAARQLVTTATPNAVKRETVHVLSQPLIDTYKNKSMPLLTLVPLSPLQASFADKSLLDSLSPGARTSIGSTSTAAANYTTAPSSPTPQSSNHLHQIRIPTPPITSRLQKRKSWHPRTLVATIKLRNESNDRRAERNNFQTTAMMIEAARLEKSKQRAGDVITNSKDKGIKPKDTPFQNRVASKSVPDLYSTGINSIDIPIPVLVLPGEERRADWTQQDEETSESESLWKRRSRRRTLDPKVTDHNNDADEALKYMSSNEHLRWKQLAMREKALADSRKAKEDTSVSSKPPGRPADPKKKEQIPAAPLAYAPKQLPTLPPKDAPKSVLPSTHAQMPQVQGYAPKKPVDSQEQTSSPLQDAFSLSKGNTPSEDEQSNSERYLDRTTSRNTLPPLPFSAPLSMSPEPLKPQKKQYTPAEKSPRLPLTPNATNLRSRRGADTAGAELSVTTKAMTLEKRATGDSRTGRAAEVGRSELPMSTPTGQKRPQPPQTKSPKAPSQQSVQRPPRLSSLPPGQEPPATDRRPESRKRYPAVEVVRPTLKDRSRSQPILNQYGEPALRPNRPSKSIHPAVIQNDEKILRSRSRAASNATRPKTATEGRTRMFSFEIAEDEIAVMTPECRRLLREQEVLLRSRQKKETSSEFTSGASTGQALNSPRQTGSPNGKRNDRQMTPVSAGTTPKARKLRELDYVSGMTPESKRLLKEREQLLSQKQAAPPPTRAFSMPYNIDERLAVSKMDDTDDEDDMSSGGKRKWRKENWWKVWRLA